MVMPIPRIASTLPQVTPSDAALAKSNKTTSFDIAYLAGVSQSTVSRALRGSPLVNADTINRVREAARQLNYTVDKHASSLRTQRSGTLALLLFEDPTADESHINPFFLPMLGSITRACARAGQDLLVSFQQLSDDWHSDYADSRKADGLILLGYGDYLAYRAKLEKLVAQRTHFVRWGAVLADQPGVSIGCDNFEGGRLVGRHLISMGCRRIAFLGAASAHFPEFFERYQGCDAALRDIGAVMDPALQVDAESSEQAGYAAALALFERGARFDALFAASDLIAIGAMHGLAEHGLRVPHHVAVVGFDDIPAARMATPPLTTVAQDTKQAGALLVQSLLRSIAGLPTESQRLPVNLVLRQSSARK